MLLQSETYIHVFSTFFSRKFFSHTDHPYILRISLSLNITAQLLIISYSDYQRNKNSNIITELLLQLIGVQQLTLQIFIFQTIYTKLFQYIVVYHKHLHSRSIKGVQES